jgi:hypothetical protein
LEKGSRQARLLHGKDLLGLIDENEPVKVAIAVYGFHEARLTEGKKLLDTAESAISETLNARSINAEALRILEVAYPRVRRIHHNTVSIAKEILSEEEDRTVLQSLGLLENRKQALDDWLAQAHYFYENLDDGTKERLSVFGIDQSRLDEEVQILLTLAEKKHSRRSAQADLSEVRVRERFAFEALDKWMSGLETILRIVDQTIPGTVKRFGLRTTGASRSTEDLEPIESVPEPRMPIPSESEAPNLLTTVHSA